MTEVIYSGNEEESISYTPLAFLALGAALLYRFLRTPKVQPPPEPTPPDPAPTPPPKAVVEPPPAPVKKKGGRPKGSKNKKKVKK